MKHIIFHHTDADGYCSNAIVCKSIVNQYKEWQEVRSVPMDYGEKIPYELIDQAKDVVYLVDFCFKPNSAVRDLALAMEDRFIWIDHHQTSEDFIKADPFPFTGIVKVGEAACQLCWDYFFPNDETPELVQRVAAYDIWDREAFDWEEQLALQMQIKNVGLLWFDWERQLRINAASKRFLNQYIEKGKQLLNYEKSRTSANVARSAYPADLKGLKVLALNTQTKGSPQFESLDLSSYDAVCVYMNVRGIYWECSLYSSQPDVDCAEVCKELGGGGHRGAAGFTCETEELFKVLKPRWD